MYLTQSAYQPKDEIKKMQETKLQELLVYLHQYSPFYKELFATHHIDIATIESPGRFSQNTHYR